MNRMISGNVYQSAIVTGEIFSIHFERPNRECEKKRKQKKINPGLLICGCFEHFYLIDKRIDDSMNYEYIGMEQQERKKEQMNHWSLHHWIQPCVSRLFRIASIKMNIFFLPHAAADESCDLYR